MLQIINLTHPHMKPTDKEITEEIAKLKALKPRIPARSRFGDDNHANVDGSVTAMEKRWTEEDLDEEEDSLTEAEMDGARSAVDWMSGDEISPCENWASAAGKED